MGYFEELNPVIKDYFNILSSEIPDFLIDYINTPRMQKQKYISTTCGMYYSKMFNNTIWYSSLDHSVAMSLIVWHFTKDKTMTLAALFHDIATPVFKHSIDFMNKDYEKQESTEDLTRTMIESSKEIMDLLNRDNIDISLVSNYHMYPICDNDIPMLSADRLEYTLSNGLGVIDNLWTLDEVNRIYSNLIILKNEDGIDELGFKDLSVSERFVEVMGDLSLNYISDKRRFGMQLIADIIKRLNKEELITIHDLYEKSEEEIINIIKSTKYGIAFSKWENASDIEVSNRKIGKYYNVRVNAKRRYIDPLVIADETTTRTSQISLKSKSSIEKVIDFSFDRYIYMRFNLDLLEVYGFKCFNSDMTNRYGKAIEVGKTYTTNGNVKFGNDSHGFHFCKNLEDTFRYFNATQEEVSICYVRGFGEIDEEEDDYNEYYDMYAAENIEIIHKLSREEIINYGLNLWPERAYRFIQTFKLNDDEIEMFKEKFKNSDKVLKAIEYYQLGNTDIYNKKK